MRSIVAVKNLEINFEQCKLDPAYSRPGRGNRKQMWRAGLMGSNLSFIVTKEKCFQSLVSQESLVIPAEDFAIISNLTIHNG